MHRGPRTRVKSPPLESLARKPAIRPPNPAGASGGAQHSLKFWDAPSAGARAGSAAPYALNTRADTPHTGAITALVVPNGPAATTALGTLNVYKNNGGTAAGAGDITISRQYTLTYVDSLNAGAGGFVLR
jgi:hypothetical protein